MDSSFRYKISSKDLSFPHQPKVLSSHRSTLGYAMPNDIIDVICSLRYNSALKEGRFTETCTQMQEQMEFMFRALVESSHPRQYYDALTFEQQRMIREEILKPVTIDFLQNLWLEFFDFEDDENDGLDFFIEGIFDDIREVLIYDKMTDMYYFPRFNDKNPIFTAAVQKAFRDETTEYFMNESTAIPIPRLDAMITRYLSVRT